MLSANLDIIIILNQAQLKSFRANRDKHIQTHKKTPKTAAKNAVLDV